MSFSLHVHDIGIAQQENSRMQFFLPSIKIPNFIALKTNIIKFAFAFKGNEVLTLVYKGFGQD